MPSIFLWTLACFGITFLIADSTVFSKPRNWLANKSRFIRSLLGCYFCTGFWVSLGLWLWLTYRNYGFMCSETDESFFSLPLGVLYTFTGATGSYALNKLLSVIDMIHVKLQLDLMEEGHFNNDEDVDPHV